MHICTSRNELLLSGVGKSLQFKGLVKGGLKFKFIRKPRKINIDSKNKKMSRYNNAIHIRECG